MRDNHGKKLRAGAILFVVAGFLYLACEAISALSWRDPAYQYAHNYISDLGIPVVTQFGGRPIHSPLHGVMNCGFISHGLLFVTAFFLVTGTLPAKRKWIGLALAVVHGIGVTMVGLFPGYDWWGEPFHSLGALLAIAGGNLAILCGGLLTRNLVHQNSLSVLGVALGLIGLAGFATFMALDGGLHAAVFERISVYTVMLWELLFGLFVLMKSPPTPRG